MYLIGLWFLAFSILGLLITRIFQMINGSSEYSRWKTVDVAGIRTDPWWRYPAHAMFGRRIWDQGVP